MSKYKWNTHLGPEFELFELKPPNCFEAILLDKNPISECVAVDTETGAVWILDKEQRPAVNIVERTYRHAIRKLTGKVEIVE